MKNISRSGIRGLDTILNGGIIENYTYLISGEAGTGKTTLSIQWLHENCRNKDNRCLFITMAEPASELKTNVEGFGWDLEGIEILDLSPKGTPSIPEEYHVFYPAEVELTDTWKQIYQSLESIKPTHLVIDSVTFLRYLSTDLFQLRKQLLNLVNYLKSIQCTAFLIYEPEEMQRDASLALSVDAVISLTRKISPAKVIDIRTLEIQKLRGSSYLSGLHPYRIGDKGIEIFPHHIEPLINRPLTNKLISSGIKELDLLLNGGLEAGTTTLLTGPAGVGKSSLAMQFLIHAVKNKQKAILYSFEEMPEFIQYRQRNLGMPIDRFIADETLQIRHINPLDLFPDEFLETIKKAHEEGVSVVAIDSLCGYDIAMEQYGNLNAHIQNLVNFLRSKQITTLFVNEVEYLTGDVRLTDLGVSFIVDNALLLRFAEIGGELCRLINCVKKRLGSFEAGIHEMKIENNKGITIGPRLSGFSGILTGIPTKAENH